MTKLSDLQRLVVEQFGPDQPGRDLLLSAGAGSGKTLVLVESVLACLRAGVPLERILVVTFTDKAAAQMKSRIYGELERDERLAPLRIRVPQAWISTIHSFCMRILRERFEKAGVDPAFRVLSDEEARLLLEDAQSRVFHECYGKRWQEFEELVEMAGFGAQGENLRNVVSEILDYARTSEDPLGFLGSLKQSLGRRAKGWNDLPWANDYARRISSTWRQALGMLRALTTEMSDRGEDPADFRAVFERLVDIDPDSLVDPTSQKQTIERFHREGLIADPERPEIKLPSLRRGLGPDFGDLKKKVAALFRDEWLVEMPLDLEALLTDEGASSRLGRALIDLTQRVWAAYEQAKDRSGRLDFHDLQIRALGLIEEMAESELPVRFDRLFVDEFQDVNSLQDRILSRLCDPAGTFRVGDVKQSIYQFRLASPEIILDLAQQRLLVKNRSSAPDDAPEWNVLLPKNYRSLGPVLAVVNRIAGNLFLPGEIGTDYADQALVTGQEIQNDGPPVEMMLIPDDGEDEEEGRAIATRIRELVEEGTTVRDEDDHDPRPLRFSDIAILLRARKHGPALARQLEQEGIPCSLGVDAPFFEAREVQDLLTILRAIDNLLDDIAVAASLRSPAFSWSDGELYALRLAYPQARHLAYTLALLGDSTDGGNCFAGSLLPETTEEREILCGEPAELPDHEPFGNLPQRSHDAIARILSWREAAGVIELPDLITRILEETGLVRSVASLPGGLRRQANLRKLLGISRRYVEESGHNLHRFLRWIEKLTETGSKISEAPVSSESVPAVRILTIHAAKGLEFPVVFVAALGSKLQIGERTQALMPGRNYLGVRLLDPEAYLLRRPVPLRLLHDQRRDDDLAEEKRVLYVALTRARDRLILSGVATKSSIPADPFRRVYRTARAQQDVLGVATAQSLLEAKPNLLTWIFYAIEGLPDLEDRADRLLSDLPLTVRWVTPTPRPEVETSTNPIQGIEQELKRLRPVEIPGGTDPIAEKVFGDLRQPRPFPSPGVLEHARGKLWATEFKTGRSFPLAARMETAEEAIDEPAVPLIAATSEDAAKEGSRIHAVLEQFAFGGMEPENLDQRLVEATEKAGEIPDSVRSMLRDSLLVLMKLPIWSTLAAGKEIEREVAFSLRIPLLEVARWFPELRAEITASREWSDWIMPDPAGAFRLRPDLPEPFEEPWVLVQGRIDLVYRSTEGWALLDWKSDRVEGEAAIDERCEIYRGQIEIYRRAVARLFGSPVSAGLYFLRPRIYREI